MQKSCSFTNTHNNLKNIPATLNQVSEAIFLITPRELHFTEIDQTKTKSVNTKSIKLNTFLEIRVPKQ